MADFSGITSSFSNLKLLYMCKDGNGSTGNILLRLMVNTDATAANYSSSTRSGAINGVATNTLTAGTTLGGYIGNQPGGGSTGRIATGELTFNAYAGVTFHKGVNWVCGTDTLTNGLIGLNGYFRYASTAGITGLRVLDEGSTFADGSQFTLYGIR